MAFVRFVRQVGTGGNRVPVPIWVNPRYVIAITRPRPGATSSEIYVDGQESALEVEMPAEEVSRIVSAGMESAW